MSSDNPFDHNAECRFCDEQAMHRADCPWLVDLVENYQLLLALMDADDYKAAVRKWKALQEEVERLRALYDAAEIGLGTLREQNHRLIKEREQLRAQASEPS